MSIPIAIQGSIRNSGKSGHRLLVRDERAASGGFVVLQWWDGSTGPNPQAGFDDWVENEAALASYFAESGWEIAWDAGIDLHDASLVAIRVMWAEGICLAEIRHGILGECVLAFSALSCLRLPREQAWGPSASIHALRQDGHNAYLFEMQSGDCIRIEAAQVELRPGRAG